MDSSKLPIVSAYDVTCAKNYDQPRGLDPELLKLRAPAQK